MPENTGEEDAQEEPASHRVGRCTLFMYSLLSKHTEPPVTVKEPDPCPGPGKAEADTVRSGTHSDVTSEEEQERSDDTQHSQPQINDLTTKMDSASSKHLRLEANYQCFLQNLFSLKSIQDRFETIDKNQKKLEEDVVNFPRHTQGTRVEGGTEQPARWDLDEKQKQVLLVLQAILSFICNVL
ncbi:Hypothetical predicted protein [Marmota monax]|uniref:Uncharacterized protein n=1 Tax=Marmota monax TaxID=9995 RepID=A0A5E4CB34_MARMO|nr:Hypothetical predicted protein [Marmota monax]